MDKLHDHKFIVQMQLADGRKWVKQIALASGSGDKDNRPEIHLEFSRETAAFLIRFLQYQLEEDRFTPGFTSRFELVDDDTTPEMQEYMEWQQRKTETEAYIRSCVKYRY